MEVVELHAGDPCPEYQAVMCQQCGHTTNFHRVFHFGPEYFGADTMTMIGCDITAAGAGFHWHNAGEMWDDLGSYPENCHECGAELPVKTDPKRYVFVRGSADADQ